jgi:recombination protein RecT
VNETLEPTQTIARRATNNLPARQQEAGSGNSLASLLESRREAMAMVLPKHLTAEKLIKVALVAVSKTPDLALCTRESVLQSVMTAAQLGLDCGGVLGSAYLVPFNKKAKDGSWRKECQLIIGYRGMVDLARRSGQISTIEARIVYQNDVFEVSYDIDGTKLVHKPQLDNDPGAFRLVYAVAKLRDGGTQFCLMTKAEVDAIRTRAKAKDFSPWQTDYNEMAKKTVIRRLFKMLPVSVEIVEAIDHDNNTDGIDLDLSTSTRKSLEQRLAEAPKELPGAIEPPPDNVETEIVEPDGSVPGPLNNPSPFEAGKIAAWELAEANGSNRADFDRAFKKSLVAGSFIGKEAEIPQQWWADLMEAISAKSGNFAYMNKD